MSFLFKHKNNKCVDEYIKKTDAPLAIFDKICLSRGNQTHFYIKIFPPNPFPSFIILCLFKHQKASNRFFF